MSSRPILHLQKQPDPRVTAWIRRLDKCDPGSPEAKAIYGEAMAAGLGAVLCDGLDLAAAAQQREARLLNAEMHARWGSK